MIAGDCNTNIAGNTSSQSLTITDSRFYSSAFNAAIFDGSFRIYFAQYQESEALKIYFSLQEELKERFIQYKKLLKDRSCNVFIMIYPSQDAFVEAFAAEKSSAFIEEGYVAKSFIDLEKGKLSGDSLLSRDIVFGLNSGLAEESYHVLFDQLDAELGLNN